MADVNTWMKAALGVSLAVNLAVAGLVAGAVWRHHGPSDRGERRGHAPAALSYAAPYMRALPKETRREMFGQMRRANLPDRDAARLRFGQVVSVLRTEPFDLAALRDLSQAQAQGAILVQSAAQEAWLDTVARMSPDARQSYAAAVEEQLARRGRAHRDTAIK